jgi:hypothetical protein
MPVRKFRTLEEAGRPIKLQQGTEEFRRVLHSVFRLAALFAPGQIYPPGVYKFRSIEESQAQKISWIRKALQKQVWK